MMHTVVFLVFVFVLFGGGGISVVVNRWLEHRRRLALREQAHRHRLELADKLDGAVKLLIADDQLRDAFLESLGIDPHPEFTELEEGQDPPQKLKRLKGKTKKKKEDA